MVDNKLPCISVFFFSEIRYTWKKCVKNKKMYHFHKWAGKMSSCWKSFRYGNQTFNFNPIRLRINRCPKRCHIKHDLWFVDYSPQLQQEAAFLSTRKMCICHTITWETRDKLNCVNITGVFQRLAFTTHLNSIYELIWLFTSLASRCISRASYIPETRVND